MDTIRGVSEFESENTPKDCSSDSDECGCRINACVTSSESLFL